MIPICDHDVLFKTDGRCWKCVHATGWCAQGDIEILCSGEMVEAEWNLVNNNSEIYFVAEYPVGPDRVSETPRRYSFNHDLVTCPACLAKLASH